MAITIKKGSVTIKKPSVEQQPPAAEMTQPPSQQPQEGIADSAPAPHAVPAGATVPSSSVTPHLVSLICGGLALCFIITLIILQLLENSGYRGYFPLSMPPAPSLSAPSTTLPEVTPASDTNVEQSTETTQAPAASEQTSLPPSVEGASTTDQTPSTDTSETSTTE